MKLIIEGTKEEIADLALAAQGREGRIECPLDVIREAFRKAIDDTAEISAEGAGQEKRNGRRE